MDGFLYVGVGILVVPFAIAAAFFAAAVLSSPRGRTWQAWLLVACAILGVAVLALAALNLGSAT